MIRKVQGQVYFLRLASHLEPDIWKGVEIRSVLQIYIEEVESAIKSKMVEEGFYGFARVYLSQLSRLPRLSSSLDDWGAKYNLQSSWAKDIVLQMLAALRVRVVAAGGVESLLDSDYEHQWFGALGASNRHVTEVLFGPEFVFSYSFPPELKAAGTEPFNIEARFRNPWKVLMPDVLSRVRETFAIYILRGCFGGSRDSSGDSREWGQLIALRDEVARFEQLTEAFARDARAEALEFLRSVPESFGEGPNQPWDLASHSKTGKRERDIRWLAEYQVKERSYGEIAQMEDLPQTTIVTAVKSAAEFIDLELRKARNRPGRKPGAKNTTTTGLRVDRSK